MPKSSTMSIGSLLTLLGLVGCAATTANEPDVIISSESEATASVVPEGTTIQTKLDQKLSVDDSKKGDAFSATLTEPVTYAGTVVVPAGAKVRGYVSAVQDQDESEYDVDVLKLAFTRLDVGGESYPLDARLIDAEPRMESGTSTGEAVAGIAGGTAVGAILGRLIGGDDKGTLIGAAVGAAAGTAIVLGTSDQKAVLPEDSPLTLRVEEPIRLARR